MYLLRVQTDEKTIWTWIDSSWLRNIYSVRFVALKQSLLIASNRTSPEQNLSGTEPTSIHIGNTDILFSLQRKNRGVTLSNNLSMEKHVRHQHRKLVTFITISLLMLRKTSSASLFCQNLTAVILFYQVLQNILTNSKRCKLLQPDLSLKLPSMNTSNPSFRNFTGYQWSQESSIKSQLCATILSLKLT